MSRACTHNYYALQHYFCINLFSREGRLYEYLESMFFDCIFMWLYHYGVCLRSDCMNQL